MIRIEGVSKIFGTGVAGLSDITLFVDKGEFVFLVGHTGSGKTTLLRLLVRDLLPTEGSIIVSDLDIVALPANKIPHLRKKVGVIFQDLKLIMDRTIIENIILPMQVSGIKTEDGIKRGVELLEMVGLAEHRDKFPIQLSGGELQRVAIARALALSPEILLADEPTGNLDPQTALEIVQLLEKINALGTTIVMATHNLEIVGKLKKRVVGLDHGKVVKDEKRENKQAPSGKEEDKKNDGSPLTSEKDHEHDTMHIAEGKKHEHVNGKEDPEISQDGIEVATHTEHKKETRKLSDLLAKARLTVQQHSEKVVPHKVKEDMPFGFEKESDIKESSRKEEHVEEAVPKEEGEESSKNI